MRMRKEREGVLLLWQPHVELNDVSNSNTPLQCDVRKAGVSNSPASLEEGDLSSCSSAAALVHWCREVKVTVFLSISLTKPGLAPHGQQGLAIGCNNGFSAGELHCILSQTTFLLSILSHYSPKLWSYFYLQNVKDHGHFSQV